MSLWRQQAFERLPEYRKYLQEEDSPYCYFGETVHWLNEAYKRNDHDLIRRIYDFAKWCAEDAPRGNDASDDLFTIVITSFYESLPLHEKIRRDVGRWLPKETIEGLRNAFLYHGTEEQYQEMLDSCEVNKFKKR